MDPYVREKIMDYLAEDGEFDITTESIIPKTKRIKARIIAEEKGMVVETITIEMNSVDRAILESDDDGFLDVYVKKGTDEILGATMVCRHAGDMISEITVAMAAGAGLGTIARAIHPYPTQAEAIKKAGDSPDIGNQKQNAA